MKIVYTAVLSLFLAVGAMAQTTTYTVSKDACGGKSTQFCTLQTTDQNGSPFTIYIDNRNSVENLYLGNFLSEGVHHGLYSGFVGNPDGTHNAYYGAASFLSDDGTIAGNFQFFAYYVATCSGRGCGGTLGWHFRVLLGSTITVQ